MDVLATGAIAAMVNQVNLQMTRFGYIPGNPAHRIGLAQAGRSGLFGLLTGNFEVTATYSFENAFHG